ncbi:MAG: pyridoxamine 5'-phosphate oxidase family protein [Hyphomonadaceae bacterium]
MPTQTEVEEKFWKALKSDRTIMLGLAGDGHAQPMTAQLDGDEASGPLWIFSASDVDLVRSIGAGARGAAQFADKGHNLFASVHGDLSVSTDMALIERLWNPFVAAWYEGGKDDPKLRLIRFDAAEAQIWLNENSLFSGVKLLLGADPKEEYKDNVADIELRST